MLVLLSSSSSCPLQQGLPAPWPAVPQFPCTVWAQTAVFLSSRCGFTGCESAFSRSPQPGHLLFPLVAGDVMLQLNPPDRGLYQESVPASPLLSCLPSSPPCCCLGAGRDGLAGKWGTNSFCRELPALGWFSSLNWLLMASAAQEQWEHICCFQWCPNDWFHSSVQETVTESCWIMAHHTSSAAWVSAGLTNEQCS